MLQSEARQKKFTDRHSTAHFELRFVQPNPRAGGGQGAAAVRAPEVIAAYAKGLELAYQHLTLSPWERRCQEGKTLVWICDLRTHHGATNQTAFFDPRLEIDLGSQPHGTCHNSDQQLAVATAAHECVHLFNLFERLKADPAQDWSWLDEGTAIYHEALLCREHSLWQRLAWNWVMEPARPLDDPANWYANGVLVDALVRDFGPELLREVWMESDSSHSALQAVSAWLEKRGTVFAGAEADDFFGGRFCVDAWFGNAAPSGSLLRALRGRYGERSLTESLDGVPKDGLTLPATLPSLSCRYYRVYPGAALPALDLQAEPNRLSALKGVVSLVNAAGQEIARQPLDRRDDRLCFRPAPDQPSVDQVDHAIVTIVHCGWRTGQERRPIEFQLIARPLGERSRDG